MSPIQIVDQHITRGELEVLAQERFGDMVKAVVDIRQGVMVVGGELHADEEEVLLTRGSRQEDLWGINLYPQYPPEQWIEFDSMINIRPSQENRSRSVEDPAIREQIVAVVDKLFA